MGLSQSATGLSLSAGLLIGLGLSGTSFSVILGAVGRAVPAEQRSMAMGISSAAGSFSQFAMLPGTLALIGWLGWSSAPARPGPAGGADRAAGRADEGSPVAAAGP